MKTNSRLMILCFAVVMLISGCQNTSTAITTEQNSADSKVDTTTANPLYADQLLTLWDVPIEQVLDQLNLKEDECLDSIVYVINGIGYCDEAFSLKLRDHGEGLRSFSYSTKIDCGSRDDSFMLVSDLIDKIFSKFENTYGEPIAPNGERGGQEYDLFWEADRQTPIHDLPKDQRLFNFWDLTPPDAETGIYTRVIVSVETLYDDPTTQIGYEITLQYQRTNKEGWY